MTLLDDLARWESGELSRAEVLVRNAKADKNWARSAPWDKNIDKNLDLDGGRWTDNNLEIASSASLDAILELHEQLTTIGSEPVPYKDSDWERLRAGLPDRLTRKRSPLTRLVGRPLVAASMVVGLSAAAAAASPAAREPMVTAWHRIEHAVGIGGESAPTHPAVSPSARVGDGFNHSGATATPAAPESPHQPTPTPRPTPTQTPSPTGAGGSNGTGSSDGVGGGGNGGGNGNSGS